MSSLQAAVDVLKRGLGTQHDGYQLYVSLKGEALLDAADGQAQPGVPLTTDSLMLWFSSTKPLTAVAIAQLWERGKIKLDDPVVNVIPEFGQGGKEKATIRHLLTHPGGFPVADMNVDLSDWDAALKAICESEAMWEPGTACGYHGTSGHTVMGEIVKRVDGRPVQKYMREEILDPLGMKDSQLGIPQELLPSLKPRLSRVSTIEAPLNPVNGEEISMDVWNTDAYIGAVIPGAGGRGPAHDLAKLYEAMVNGGERQGARILSPQTVETIIACHRRGMTDLILEPAGMPPGKYGYEYPWGLSMMLDGNPDIGSKCSQRVFGHSGAMSSVAFGDPETGLACAIITNGLIPLDKNGVRLSAVSDAANDAIRS